jgi:hypothetical protein
MPQLLIGGALLRARIVERAAAGDVTLCRSAGTMGCPPDAPLALLRRVGPDAIASAQGMTFSPS